LKRWRKEETLKGGFEIAKAKAKKNVEKGKTDIKVDYVEFKVKQLLFLFLPYFFNFDFSRYLEVMFCLILFDLKQAKKIQLGFDLCQWEIKINSIEKLSFENTLIVEAKGQS